MKRLEKMPRGDGLWLAKRGDGGGQWVHSVTARPGNSLAMLKDEAPPAVRARNACPEMRCCPSATHAAVNRADNMVPQVL